MQATLGISTGPAPFIGNTFTELLVLKSATAGQTPIWHFCIKPKILAW